MSQVARRLPHLAGTAGRVPQRPADHVGHGDGGGGGEAAGLASVALTFYLHHNKDVVLKLNKSMNSRMCG